MSTMAAQCVAGANSEFAEMAPLYVLGELSPAEARRFEEHADHCGACASEMNLLGEVCYAVAESLEPVAPPAKLRSRVLHDAVLPDGVAALVRADAGEFKPTEYPGVFSKVLFFDPASGALATILRVDAGAQYPAHAHAGIEHTYVIDGDVVFEDHALDTGDYEAAKPGSQHSKVATAGGCTILLLRNIRDRVISGTDPSSESSAATQHLPGKKESE